MLGTVALPSRNGHSRITLQPKYGRFVTAFCGTFWPGVADHGLTQGAAPRSSSARTRADTSAYRSRFIARPSLLQPSGTVVVRNAAPKSGCVRCMSLDPHPMWPRRGWGGARYRWSEKMHDPKNQFL